MPHAPDFHRNIKGFRVPMPEWQSGKVAPIVEQMIDEAVTMHYGCFPAFLQPKVRYQATMDLVGPPGTAVVW